MTVRIKRVYEEATAQDGYRVLVDRIWPRGISKERAAVDEWVKEAGPSTELRQWFGHVPERYEEFAPDGTTDGTTGQSVRPLPLAACLTAPRSRHRQVTGARSCASQCRPSSP